MLIPPRVAALILLIVGLQASFGVWAQQSTVPFQFSFSDPGARSMGFGGAFVALADDATAAFSNPAGLVQLAKPEFSIEGRSWRYSTPYTVGGRIQGVPSGNGLDATAGLRTATSKFDVTGLSFLSFAYPTGKWSFAFYRHESANLEFYGETQGLFGGGSDCCQLRWYDQQGTSKWDAVSYGFSSSYRVNDKLDVGFGVAFQDMQFVSDTTEFLWDEDSDESFYGPNSYLLERANLNERMVSDDTDFTFAGGFLLRLSERWNIGGVYRQGMESEIGITAVAGAANRLGAMPGEVVFQLSGIPVKFPDFYGLGLAYRANDGRLTLSFQWDYIQYSDIPDSLKLDDQTMDDVSELHLGAEYVFLDSTPVVALRLGAWHEPNHQMRATTEDPLIRALLREWGDEMHYSAGLGLAFENFQVDLGVDFSDSVDTLSLSAIYSF